MLDANQLKKILSDEGEDISALLDILSKQESIKLHKYFESGRESSNALDDIQIKFFALNAIFIYIQNNPSIADQVRESGIPIEDLAFKIYELSSIVYDNARKWENYFYLSSYAVLADKATLLTTTNQPDRQSDLLSQILQFFISFSLPVRSRDDLDTRQSDLEKIRKSFTEAQLPKNIDSQASLYEIVAISNLVNLGEKLQTYLLKGDGSDIQTNINASVSNAIKVFAEAGNRAWELICSLLRITLQKHYDNSIWTHANRFPFFKDFVNRQIEQSIFLLSLFPSQKAALQDILASQQSTVISMPTSTGKTLLAELKILYTTSLYGKCLCVYVVPTNALINQTVKLLSKSFPDLAVRQLLPYNHFDQLEEDLIGEQPDVIVSTPEKFNFLLRNDDSKILKNLRLVVIDEAHNISDQNRGTVWEFLLANLKHHYNDISYLLLTPFSDNKEEIAQWLGGQSNVARSISWTPTKQYVAYHSLHNSKSNSKVNYLPGPRNSIIKESVSIDLNTDLQDIKKQSSQDSINGVVRNIVLVEKYSQQSGCILVLHKGVDSVEKLAKEFANRFNFADDTTREKISYAQEVIRLELGEGHLLTELLDKGIAFHHARLSPMVKEVVEDLISENLIKVLVATTTLAQGLNFPIKTIIFETLHPGGGGSSTPLTHSTFWNIAGRAGRAYKDTEGHIVLGWKNGNEWTKEKLESLIKQDIEKTISSLTAFFAAIDESTTIDYQFIKDEPIAQNFLHYLNHLMRVSYQYQLDEVSRQDIVNILANSLYFKQNEFSEGFLETQEKVVNFSNQYISLIRQKGPDQLKLADTLGITDISLSTIIGIAQGNDSKLSQCIEKNDRDGLSSIISAIHSIPELKISLGRQEGGFNAELIAGILLDWINGESIARIANRHGCTINECSGYIFSKLKNYIPWGMAIYQSISNDENPLLPSYAFYGVKDERSVKLSYLGVPRFALHEIKKLIRDDSLYTDIQSLREFLKEQELALEDDQRRNKMINNIIKQAIL